MTFEWRDGGENAHMLYVFFIATDIHEKLTDVVME